MNFRFEFYVLFFTVLVCSISLCANAIVVDDDVQIQGQYLDWIFSYNEGGVLHTLKILGKEENLAGIEGLLQEGFGVGSYYLPNRRLNERLEIVDPDSKRPMLRYLYDCDGPNIKGLQVTRTMEPLPDEMSCRVTWMIENKGNESQWISPWVRNEIRENASNKTRIPTLDGVMNVAKEAYYPASRNWIALTEAANKESVCAIFHADHTHAFLTMNDDMENPEGVQTAFVPRLLKPGEVWTTIYRLNVVRGLDHVDFADDAIAAQIDYDKGKFSVLLTAAKPMEHVEIEGRIVAENGRLWKLSRKRFDIAPTKLARCTWDWQPPGDGVYEFMAQLFYGDQVIPLGQDTGSPHGGVDTFFTVGNSKPRLMEAWTDAPYMLDRGLVASKGCLAVGGDVPIWFASSLDKVFRQDSIVPEGLPDPTMHLALAGNEYESFQICLRPPVGQSLQNVRVTVEPLINRATGKKIPVSDIAMHNVRYHQLRIPSHYEGPTGWFPDALPTHEPFTAEGGVTSPVWITVYAKAELPAGVYHGPITVTAAGQDPWELWLDVQVYDFDLPTTPSLKTDFGFSFHALSQQYKRLGMDPNEVAQRYLQNALEHRVTLREFCQLPRESADYQKELDQYFKRLGALKQAGAGTFYVPATLLEAPVQLEQANAFVKAQQLQDRAFTQLAYEPEEPAWNRVLEKMQHWKDMAPDIPITVSTMGLRPFIPDMLDIWSVHAQVLDTTQNITVLERAAEGKPVWWYVNHTPPRPYGNFFMDFAAIEHRILFWQSWALGMRGMQYWSVNNWPDDDDPYAGVTDITPVNGDGVLIYPDKSGPVSSIRWEIIRDGLEDYDYLTLFMEQVNKLSSQPGNEALLQRVAKVYNLEDIVPSLVTFTRDPQTLLNKRREIAGMIEELGKRR